MNTTTIQIKNETKDLLNNLKKSYNSNTYDEVIQAMARAKAKSLYGSLAGKGRKSSFLAAMKILKGLRGSGDRFATMH